MGAIRICSKGRQTSPAFACRVGHRRRVLVSTDLAGEQGEVFAERAFYCWPGRELGHRFARFWPKIRTYGHATGRRTTTPRRETASGGATPRHVRSLFVSAP